MSIDTVGPPAAEPDTLHEVGGKGRRADALAEGAVPRLVAALRRVDVARLVQLLAVIPAVGMLQLVLRASDTQWFDYWMTFPDIVNPDGSLAVRRLVFFHNEHVMAVPYVIFWLNYKLTSGLNTTLGVFVVGLAAVQVVLLRRMLPSVARLGRWAVSLLFVGFAVLVFAPQGAHNFARAMSGTAWLSANVLSLLAVLAVHRRWRGDVPLALGLAGLATLSYGTGLMAWPAVLVVLVLQRRSARAVLPVAAVWLVVAGAYFGLAQSSRSADADLDLNGVAHRTVQVLGSVVATDPDMAVATGLAAVILAGLLIERAVRLDRLAAAPWVALVVYTVLGAAMIGFARGAHGDDVGASSRYASLSALCWCGLLALAVLVRPGDVRVLAAGLLAVGLAFVGGRASVAEVDEWNVTQDELAIAMRLDVSEGYPKRDARWPDLYADSTTLMQDIGHHPFSGSFQYDCGLLDETLSLPATPTSDEAGPRGRLDDFLPSYNNDSVRMHGWVVSPGEPVRCVLVVDADDRVVGMAVYGTPRADVANTVGSSNDELGFVATARGSERSYQAVAVLADGQLVLLDHSLSP
jgi:hypothetical protein